LIEKEKSGSSIKVLDKALDLLELLAQQDSGVSLGWLSRQLNFPRSTVQRLVESLERRGWVQKGDQDASITLGIKVSRLGWLSRKENLLGQLHALVERIHKATHETIVCARLQEGRLHFLASKESPELLRATLLPLEQIPIFQSSIGKVLVAELPQHEIEILLQATAFLPQQRAKLLDEIASARSQAIAFDHEELHAGICSFAMRLPPVGADSLAIALVAPTVRYHENQESYREVMRHEIEKVMVLASPL
jgi:DNA-binding IclR family transcriptional regulator